MEIVRDGLSKEDLLDELGLSELEGDAVLSNDDAWNAEYKGGPEAREAGAADPDEWIHACLTRLLPERMQANKKIWNATISALRNVGGKEQLDAMSRDDLKLASVPLAVRHYLLKASSRHSTGDVSAGEGERESKVARGGWRGGYRRIRIRISRRCASSPGCARLKTYSEEQIMAKTDNFNERRVVGRGV